MKKRKTKYKWNNIFKAVSGLFLIVVTIIAIVGSCNRTQASEEVQTKMYFDVPLSYELQDYIFNLCEKYEIAPEIVIAIIERESNYDTYAVGDNGESVGLMQIQEHNHYDRIERLGVTNLFDAIDNVEVGVDYLAQCITRNGGNLEMALIAYNAGQSGAETNYFSKGIYSNAYSQKVLEIAKILKEGMIEMPITDDPHRDFDRDDARKQEALEKCPVCCCCGDEGYIQDDHYFLIEDEIYCYDHMVENFRKDTGDYINE